MNRMVRCCTVPALLDLAYDAVRGGLGYDRVSVLLLDPARGVLIERVATDEAGRKVYPDADVQPSEGHVLAELLSDERMGAEGRGFVYRAGTAQRRSQPAAEHPPDGPALYVALRTSHAVLGLLSVANLPGAQPVTAADAPPLVALGTALATALENAMLLERRSVSGATVNVGNAVEVVHAADAVEVGHAAPATAADTMDTELRRRITELEWLRAISQRVHGAATLDAVLDAIYEGIREGPGYDRVRIGLVDHARKLYQQCRSTDAQGRKIAPAGRVLSIAPDAPLRRVPSIDALLRGAAFYYSADVTAETPRELRYLLDGTPAQTLVVPLRCGETVNGLIAVDNALSGRPITPGDAAPLLALAGQIGAAVEQARLRERERHEHEQLRSARVPAGSPRQEADALTGLLNHRALLDCLDAAIADGGPFTLLLIDVDNFKLFNDTHGHVTGDAVLGEVATALRCVCAEEDVPGRYGDDEFALLLHGATGARTRAVLRRLEGLVRERPHVTPDGTIIPLSISAGLACYPADGLTGQQLIAVAEGNLAAAKHGGPGARFRQRGAALLEDGHVGVLNGLVTAVNTKDRYTREHSEDVTRWALLLAEAVGLDSEQRRVLTLAGPLHDVGKIAVPDRILRKPGKLTREEYATMQHHVAFGVAIIQGVLHDAAVIDAVAHHHERWDGKGYPHGLAGVQAPLLGRIMQIADAVSAMRLNRPYRQALPWTRIVAELRAGAGTQFDPDLVEPFIGAAKRLRA